MKQNVSQINGGITINVDVSIKKNIIYVKKNIFRILVLVFVKMEKIFHNQVIFPHSRNFSTIKELFQIQGTFPQSKRFPAI